LVLVPAYSLFPVIAGFDPPSPANSQGIPRQARDDSALSCSAKRRELER